MTQVAGVDGVTREGYMVVTLEQGRLAGLTHVEDLPTVLELTEGAEVLVVNLPVGHDARSGTSKDGVRVCDLTARERWGERRDLPLVPPFEVLEQATLEAAKERAQARGWPTPSEGLWHLREKVMALQDHAQDARLHEGRSELSYALLAQAHGQGDAPLARPQGWAGTYERLKLLSQVGLRPARSTGGVGLLSPRDTLAASALAWTAHRISEGVAQPVPADPPVDPATQRPVAIWV
ncbi:MAG: DUF429 domain-containing protein [Candidatus Thermoplasmatota archaeon]|nr:DUF429 domain-containing protein [Candidatus Thermoplasmatota archaeon]